MLDKSSIITSITDYLAEQDDIVFAYLFGSFVRKEKFQDVDIAIFASSDLDLLRLGEIQTELHIATKQKIDIVYFNQIHKQNPALGHEIFTTGQLLLDKDPLVRKAFNEKIMLTHFDNADLNKKMQEAFNNRIKSKKIGVRSYAR
jgi:predicted nucleotidyltransferase